MDSSILDTPRRAMAQKTPNALPALPYELVEAILVNLPPEDLILSAATLPPFWRSVLCKSSRIFSRLAPLIKALSSSTARVPDDYKHAAFSFKCLTPNGMLIAHRRANGQEGFLLWPTRVAAAELVVLDAGAKVARYRDRSGVVMRGGLVVDYGVVELRRLGGEEVVVRKSVGGSPEFGGDGLWGYLSTFGEREVAGR